MLKDNGAIKLRGLCSGHIRIFDLKTKRQINKQIISVVFCVGNDLMASGCKEFLHHRVYNL